MDQNSSLNVPVEPAPSPSKLPMILLILVLAVGSGAAGFFLGQTLSRSTPPTNPSGDKAAAPIQSSTPTVSSTPAATVPTDETASWKTYTSDRYKYSIKYPPLWSLKRTAVVYYPEIEVERVTLQHPNYSSNFVYVDMEAREDDWPGIEPNTFGDAHEYTFAGIKSYRRSFRSTQNGGQEIVYFQRGRNYFTFQLVDDRKEFTDLFNQILSTFRFLD